MKEVTRTSAQIAQMAAKLEVSECLLHSCAFVVVHDTVRLLQNMAKSGTSATNMEPSAKATLIADLKRLSSTVADPARTRMRDAAAYLEQL